MVRLILTNHAKDMMKLRRISRKEVEEAFIDAQVETPGRTSREVNRWGYTQDGRRLRITVRARSARVVISVVAPEEEGS